MDTELSISAKRSNFLLYNFVGALINKGHLAKEDAAEIVLGRSVPGTRNSNTIEAAIEKRGNLIQTVLKP
ncbi:MAG: hypothetical protein NUW37_02375 [Planctomycetes bacterium]|nr:hypothetical protein [Planctomycetota bacterium]